ncbi:MAG: patatin-like phospholipase family protein [Chloroflexota bacterium]
MQYDLVFEGGGAKGMVFVGAMQEFEARGHTHGRLLGTSAGAITAALLAAGYGSGEMLEALAEKDESGRSVFASFMGEPSAPDPQELKTSAVRDLLEAIDLPLVPEALETRLDDRIVEWLSGQAKGRHLLSFVDKGGWFSADNFLAWLRKRLDSGSLNGSARDFSRMTLSEFFAATGKDLTLIGSDTTGGRMLALNHNTAPGLPVVYAVRMSMSIPLLWQEVTWQKEWGRYRGDDITGHAIVDGGLLSNFPIELFLSDLKPVTEVMGARTSRHVIGLLIDESRSVPGAEGGSTADGFSLSGLETVKRISNLVDTMLSARDKMVIDAFESMVLRLPAKGFGTTEFDMTDERKKLLVGAGKDEMEKYFNRQQSAAVSFAAEAVGEGEATAKANRLASRMLE